MSRRGGIGGGGPSGSDTPPTARLTGTAGPSVVMMPEPSGGRCGIAGVEPAMFGLVGVIGLLRGDVGDTLRSTDVIPAAGTCCFTTFAVAAGGAVASVAGRITSD